jgi:hypothetical protein
MTDIAASAGRRRFGALSIWIAVATFAATFAFDQAYVQILKSGNEPLRHAAVGISDIYDLAVEPLAHVAGLGLGIAAMFRHGDRRGLGLVGALLNGGALLIWFVLVDLVWKAISAFG